MRSNGMLRQWALLAAGCLCLASTVSQAATTYKAFTYTTYCPSLATSTAKGINSAGQVTGEIMCENIQSAYIYTPNVGYKIFYPSSSFQIRAINEGGSIVGDGLFSHPDGRDHRQGFIYTPGGPVRDLRSLLLDTEASDAIDLKENGDIVGSFVYSNGYTYAYRLVGGTSLSILLPPDGWVQNTWAIAANNRGEVIGGGKTTDGVVRPLLWRSNGSPVDLRTMIPLSNFWVSDINDTGDIVGGAPDAGAFIWSESRGLRFLGDSLSAAKAVSNAGQVIGTSDKLGVGCFLWDEVSGFRTVRDLIDPSDHYYQSLSCSTFEGFSQDGRIVGLGTTSRADWPVLGFSLTPFFKYTAELLDPYPDLLNGIVLTGDVNKLISSGRPVIGAAADGASRILVRVPVPLPGQAYDVTLSNDNPYANADELGAISARDKVPEQLIKTTLISEQVADGRAFLFVHYKAPVDFSWRTSDESKTTRIVGLNIKPPDVTGFNTDLMITRPPVVLVHGLWDSAAAWAHFTPLISSLQFYKYIFDYEGTNALSFNVNAKQLRDFVAASVKDNRIHGGRYVSVSKVDVVAHSMGGNITRTLPGLKGYKDQGNYDQGWIHKAITIGTPHLGSPFARDLLKTENSCLQLTLQWFTSLKVYLGAIKDLSGNGDGTGMSQALEKQKSVPMALIGGWLPGSQIQGLSKWLRKKIDQFCILTPNPPLADLLTPERIAELLTAKHDGIVPLTSAMNNGNGIVWGDGVNAGGVHSEGTEEWLGFSGPTLLQADALPAQATIILLNTPVTDLKYKKP